MTTTTCGIDALRTRIGDEVGVSPWKMVTQPMIDAFADVTDDHQFIHLDPERSRKETPFGGTVAHGFLTLSCLSSFANACLPIIEGTGMSINYGFNRLRFVSPVLAGASIRGRFALKTLEETESHIALTWDTIIEIRDQERPAVIAEWITRKYLAG